MFLAGFIPFLVLGIYGDVIIMWVFGSDWEVTGQYVQILSPWFLVLFVLAPASAVFEVCLKQKIRFKLNIFTLIVRLAVLSISYLMTHDVMAILTAFVIANVVIEIFIAGVSLFLSIDHDRKIRVQ